MSILTTLPASLTSNLSLDMAFRRILVFSKLYTKSWGDPLVLSDLREYWRMVMSQGKVIDILNSNEKNPMIITKREERDKTVTMEGHFQSPHALEFPHHMPGPIQKAHWRGVFPKNERKALIIHLAGTGDHTYFRRERGFVLDLLKETGTAGIMLDNPFYANRKPPNQFRSSLWNVSDLFVMGAALMAESLYLLRWAYNEGYWPLGISGVSMGGHMACLAASNAIFPVIVTPCLSWTTAAPVFTTGALSCAVPFDEVLQKQLNDATYREKLEAIPSCNWLDRAKARQDENKRSLAHNLMWILMHDFTDLGQYPVPLDSSLVHSVVAEQDYYVLREGTSHLTELWRDAKVEIIPERGHVSGYLACHSKFRSAIAGRIEAALKKYPQSPVIL